MKLMSLFLAAALFSQCRPDANTHVDSINLSIDYVQPHVVPSRGTKLPRRFKKFVQILTPPATEIRRLSGERVELDCVAIGNPPPTIYWMKNGQIIQDPSEEGNEMMPVMKGIARIHSKMVISTSAPGEDDYACIAKAGMQRVTATSTVITMPTNDDQEDLLALEKLFLPTKPIITYNYGALLQELGSAAVLPCRVHSQAPAQVVWQDNYERTIHENPRMRVLPSGDLLISSLLASDMGNFTCVAENMYGMDTTITFVYLVKPKNNFDHVSKLNPADNDPIIIH